MEVTVRSKFGLVPSRVKVDNEDDEDDEDDVDDDEAVTEGANYENSKCVRDVAIAAKR